MFGKPDPWGQRPGVVYAVMNAHEGKIAGDDDRVHYFLPLVFCGDPSKVKIYRQERRF
jgi:hypothetical protein